MISALVCVLGLSSCNAALSEAPPRVASAAPAPALPDSVFTLSVSAPYANLVKAAEGKIPPSIPIGGSGPAACANVPFLNPGDVRMEMRCVWGLCTHVPVATLPSIGTKRACADYQWNATVQKDGALALSKAESRLRVSQNIHISGKAGLNGTLAELFSISGKSVDVKVAAVMDVAARLDKAWCPVVSVTPVGTWVKDAKVEIIGENCLGPLRICVGPVNVSITEPLNAELDKHRKDMESAASAALSCDQIKSGVAPHWRAYAIKIERASQTPLYLNIEPKSAGFSGLLPEADRLRVVLRVAAQTTISSSPIATSNFPLPALDEAAADHGTLAVSLQAAVPYALIKEELSAAIKGKVFHAETPAGAIDVKVNEVDVYPSSAAIVVGLRIAAKTPKSWLNTSGWIFVSGQPSLAKDRHVLKVENVAFSSILDKKLWSVAQALFEGQILDALRARSSYDFSGEITKGAQEINKAIANANVPGLKLTAGAPSIALTGLRVRQDDVVVDAATGLSLDAEVTEGLIQ